MEAGPSSQGPNISFSSNNSNATRIHELSESVNRKICTGQVIISLPGACRELIDNALDAGATNIEIRALENGTESMEVIDNGSGISSTDFERLCKPHCTSKLAVFDDFNSLTSYGFRGEALNALAALSDIQILTRAADSRCAWRLTFDRNGDIVQRDQSSRSQGTTVFVSNLFKLLPVRRKELIRSARREFLKVVQCVQAFALSRPDCRFSCSNIANGKRSQVLTSPGGSASLPAVIENLFAVGIGKNDLLELEEATPDEEIEQFYGLSTQRSRENMEQIYEEIRISGYVSSCERGKGRNNSDRQFVFVNRRHVDYPKICRVANEVYGQYNRGQHCILVLFVDIPPSKLDVNVSPDKRTVFVHHEKELFAKIRASLLATFSKVLGVCPVATTPDSRKKSKISTLLHWRDSLKLEVMDGEEESEQIPKEMAVDCEEEDVFGGSIGNECVIFLGTSANDGGSGNLCSRLNQNQNSMDIAANSISPEAGSLILLDVNAPECIKEGGEDIVLRETENHPNRAGKCVQSSRHDERELHQPNNISIDLDLDDGEGEKPAESSNQFLEESYLNKSVNLLASITDPQLKKRPRTSTAFEEEEEITPSQRHSQLCVYNNSAATQSTGFVSAASLFERNLNVPPEYEPEIGNCQQKDANIQRLLCQTPMKRARHMSLEEEEQKMTIKTAISSTSTQFPEARRSETLAASENLTEITAQNRTFENVRLEESERPADLEKETGLFGIGSPIDRLSSTGRFPVPSPSGSSHSESANTNFSVARPHQTVNVNLDVLKKRFCQLKKWRTWGRGKHQQENEPRIVGAELDFDELNAELVKREIERKLSLMLSKSDFSRMQLIGQFNNAFLLTRLENQLFMVDQHAADEKFNFEQLQSNATIHSQRLIDALPLRLGSVNTALLRDNLQLFRSNGFQFQFGKCQADTIELDDDGNHGDEEDMENGFQMADKSTTFLIASPNLSGYHFDQHDIDQLLSMIAEAPGQMHRPNKIRTIFASKACRKSVMFGASLPEAKMQEIIQNMGHLEQPWNCPHGRPTIRHLCTIHLPQ